MHCRLGVSHVALSMSAKGDLTLHHQPRGCPKSSEKIKCSNYLRTQLEKLKKQMNYEDGTEVLLALSVASDEMIRHVHMFPEVFYMDVTPNTIRQKHDLFLTVIKDYSGKTFIGNATVIPSGQWWVFHKIYESFFVHFYGEVTLSQN